MAPMSTRERVERTLRCEETDRVPLYDLLRNDAAFAHFSGQPLPALGPQADAAELEHLAARATGAFLDMTRAVGFGPVVEQDVTDEFGFVYHHAPFEKTVWILRRPFADVHGAAAFLKRWILRVRQQEQAISANPQAHRERYHQSFLHTQAHLGDTVNLLAQHGLGLDDVRHLLGMELFCYVDADEPGLISEALEAVTRRNIAECHAVADPSLSPAVLTYGDIACKERLLHSPAFLRREFFPRLHRLNDAWHGHGLKCLFHSDGQLMEVMDDLLETGIDGLNPIETVAGMGLAEVRQRYGHRLFLAGGIDMSQLLSRGTPEEVRAVCRQAIRDAYPGYLMGSTTEADNSCRLANLLAMREVALEGIGA
ncbi:MAG: uroporphyrinogen decarboxylase family protein [Candidatus Latescibacterota bacterium]